MVTVRAEANASELSRVEVFEFVKCGHQIEALGRTAQNRTAIIVKVDQTARVITTEIDVTFLLGASFRKPHSVETKIAICVKDKTIPPWKLHIRPGNQNNSETIAITAQMHVQTVSRIFHFFAFSFSFHSSLAACCDERRNRLI